MTSSRPHSTAARGHRACAGLFAALALLAAGLGLAACGSGSSDPNAAGTAADNALKFSQCMREHGVTNFPNPEVKGNSVKLTLKAGGPGGSVNPQTLEAAQNACKHFQAADEPHLTPQERIAREEQVLKFARCMREHGVDLHASAGGGSGVKILLAGHPGSGGPNPESPAFQAAQKACAGLLPFKHAPPGAQTSQSAGGKGAGTNVAIGG
jgi:hypothetical protein